MKSDFLIAITQLAAEKNLPREVIFSAVEQALASAYKKEGIGDGAQIAVKIVAATGEVTVYTQRTVVEESTDPITEIAIKDARKIQGGIQIGDILEVETTPKNAGRIAAQTAKQVVLQRLREAEREHVYEEYADREGDIVSGVVQRLEPKQIVVDLGNAEAILPLSEQVRGERYRIGGRLRFYVLEVNRSTRGPQVILSRTHKNLLRRLLELEVPEIFSGVVEIKALAREPGHRSKVAVAARQEGIDPVGACIGMRGIRIQNVVNELDGERIDVIQWQPKTTDFIASALSPAQVTRVETDEATNTATVIVPDRQLSLAIGREGQNARLAAKLTSWRIDIKSVTAADEEKLAREAAVGSEEAVATALPEPRALPEAAAALVPEQAAAALAPEQAAAAVREVETVVVAAPQQTAPVSPRAPAKAELVAPPAVAAAPQPASSPAELKELEELERQLKELEVQEAAAAPPAPAEEAPEEPAAPEELRFDLVEERRPLVPGAPVIRFAEELLPGRASRALSKRAQRRAGLMGAREEEEGKGPGVVAPPRKGRRRRGAGTFEE